jgi:hypothetical protein
MSMLNARMSDGSVIQLIGLRSPGMAEFLQLALEQKRWTQRNAPPANSAING